MQVSFFFLKVFKINIVKIKLCLLVVQELYVKNLANLNYDTAIENSNKYLFVLAITI